MKFTTKRVEPAIVVLEMSGRFVMGQDCHQVDQEVDKHIAAGDRSLIFDLSAVDHIDSGAVGQIVKSFTKVRKSGGTLRLAGVRGMVDSVLKMTQLNRAIEIFPTAAEAAKSFPLAQ
jgi:anti-sigma B factor antagonist